MTRLPRVLTLLPSATEIVCALGYEQALVGRSHECDFPSSVTRLPSCSRSRLPLQGDSRSIDGTVKSIVSQGLSVYEVDADRIKSLAPDLIVTQTQCEVCAVSRSEVERAVCEWTGERPQIVSLEPSTLAGVWRDIERVARALGAPARGQNLVAALDERMQRIAAAARALASVRRVWCVEWIEPLMAAGNWTPELVTMAGGKNLLSERGIHSPWLEWDAVRAVDPEIIVSMPCGFSLPKSRREARALARLPGWQELAAVRTGRLYVTDGHQYFNRPGPRLVESLEILAEIVHPEYFDFAHRERGRWEKW